MAIKQPPYANGVMVLTDEQIIDIKTKLDVIISAFEPSDEQPVIDTFYITSTFNKENPDAPVNGDTVQFILTPVEEQPAESGV